MGEKEPGHTSCSEHLSIELLVKMEQEMEDAIEPQVVNAFLPVELGSLKVTM